MTIQEFAEKYRLRIRRDGCFDPIIPGRSSKSDLSGLPDRPEYRPHIFEGFNDGKLGIFLAKKTARKSNFIKKQLVANGFCIKQEGYEEFTAVFDPTDHKQARLAMRVCR